MVNVFIDEDSVYQTDPYVWNVDRAAWNANVATYGGPALQTSVIVPNGFIANTAGQIRYSDITENPVLADFTAGVESGFMEWAATNEVEFIVDESGSMTIDTLQPGLDDFLDWMDTNSLLWRVRSFNTERYLQQANAYTYWTLPT